MKKELRFAKREDLPESPGRAFLRLRLEQCVRGVAEVIASQVPPGFGFMLMMFEFGAGGSLAYASSGERATVLETLEEFLGREGHDLAAENQRLRRRLEELEGGATS